MLDIITVLTACFITFIAGVAAGAYIEYKSEVKEWFILY